MTGRGAMTEPWYGDVIRPAGVSMADDLAGAAPLAVARHLPQDEATTVDERYHDDEAGIYESYCRVPRVAAAEGWILPWIRRRTPVGVTVDLGCGTGRVAKALAGPPARHVIAVDRSSGMLAVARHQVPSSGVLLLRADARALPLHDQSVDSVVCSGVLHHMATWPDALREAARILRPGGRLIVREPNAAYPAWLFAPVEEAMDRLARRRPRRTQDGPGAATTAPQLSPVEQPISLPALVSAAEGAGFRLAEAGSAMLLGSLGLPDAIPAQQLYFRPANVIDRLALRHLRPPLGALLLAVFTAEAALSPAPPS
ncbi:MAG: class I SAM-dependent methyltransferase [Acidimicrobiia bacterium]